MNVTVEFGSTFYLGGLAPWFEGQVTRGEVLLVRRDLRGPPKPRPLWKWHRVLVLAVVPTR